MSSITLFSDSKCRLWYRMPSHFLARKLGSLSKTYRFQDFFAFLLRGLNRKGKKVMRRKETTKAREERKAVPKGKRICHHSPASYTNSIVVTNFNTVANGGENVSDLLFVLSSDINTTVL